MRLKLRIEKSDTSAESGLPMDVVDETIVPLNLGSVDFRHLSAFKQVYLEKNYANAGLNLSTTRKSIRRMMDNLERVFECSLFKEGEKGDLSPTAFSERLFNDLRFLHAAQCRLKDHIASVHESGRILHISSSPAVFRTPIFRQLFKELQSVGNVRLSYTPVDSEEASKALLSGRCDLYIGTWKGHPKRYITVDAGNVPYHFFQRAPSDRERKSDLPKEGHAYLVNLDGMAPDPKRMPDCGMKWHSLSEKQWMRWLSYPEECATDTLICAPNILGDPSKWTPWEALGTTSPIQLHLYANFLRQHPYEFLPALAGKIRIHAHA